MLFNSFGFLVLFAIGLIVYHLTPRYQRWWLLLAASLAFYATYGAAYVPLLVTIGFIGYAAGIAIDRAADGRRRLLFGTSLTLVLGVLLVFKYYDFAVGTYNLLRGLDAGRGLPRLGLPVVAGLSFYTFSCASYLFDVYRRQMSAERHLGHYLLYLAFFPKLLAGPIERATPFLQQIRHPRPFLAERLWSGLHVFLWGLFKKVVIADGLAPFVDAAYGQPALALPADLVIATYFEAVQIYCDFSGYSDMAIGLAQMLGIDLLENFKRPYFSTSVPEFWAHRWHLSLGRWFRDYLYVPLGGSRVPWPRHAINVLIVFVVSGLWHGANWTFVVWGGLNGLFIVSTVIVARCLPALHRQWQRMPVFVQRLATFHLILVTWVYFRAASLDDAWTIMSRIAGAGGALPTLVWMRLGTGQSVMIGLCLLMFAVEWFEERRPVREMLLQQPTLIRWSYYYAVLALLAICGSWGVRQFVYMQF